MTGSPGPRGDGSAPPAAGKGMGVSEPSYTFRASPFARSRTYRLNPDDFEWRDGRGGGRAAYKDIARVEVCKERFLGSSASYWRCVLYPKSGGKIRLGASEGGGLDARVILSQCLSRLNELEEQTLDTTTRAFVRVASEDLKNDQLLLIVREQGDVRLASGVGAHGKAREMLNDALQTVGGERRRR